MESCNLVSAVIYLENMHKQLGSSKRSGDKLAASMLEELMSDLTAARNAIVNNSSLAGANNVDIYNSLAKVFTDSDKKPPSQSEYQHIRGFKLGEIKEVQISEFLGLVSDIAAYANASRFGGVDDTSAEAVETLTKLLKSSLGSSNKRIKVKLVNNVHEKVNGSRTETLGSYNSDSGVLTIALNPNKENKTLLKSTGLSIVKELIFAMTEQVLKDNPELDAKVDKLRKYAEKMYKVTNKKEPNYAIGSETYGLRSNKTFLSEVMTSGKLQNLLVGMKPSTQKNLITRVKALFDEVVAKVKARLNIPLNSYTLFDEAAEVVGEILERGGEPLTKSEQEVVNVIAGTVDTSKIKRGSVIEYTNGKGIKDIYVVGGFTDKGTLRLIDKDGKAVQGNPSIEKVSKHFKDLPMYKHSDGNEYILDEKNGRVYSTKGDTKHTKEQKAKMFSEYEQGVKPLTEGGQELVDVIAGKAPAIYGNFVSIPLGEELLNEKDANTLVNTLPIRQVQEIVADSSEDYLSSNFGIALETRLAHNTTEVPSSSRIPTVVIENNKKNSKFNKEQLEIKAKLDEYDADNPYHRAKSVYNGSEDLKEVGTFEEYLNYVSAIFPLSKVTKVLYHGTGRKFDNFSSKHLGETTGDGKYKDGTLQDSMNATFFSDTKGNTDQYTIIERQEELGNKYGVLRNLMHAVASNDYGSTPSNVVIKALNKLNTVSPDLAVKLKNTMQDTNVTYKDFRNAVRAELKQADDLFREYGESGTINQIGSFSQAVYAFNYLKDNIESMRKDGYKGNPNGDHVYFYTKSDPYSVMTISDEGKLEGRASLNRHIGKNITELSLKDFDDLIDNGLAEVEVLQSELFENLEEAGFNPTTYSVIVNVQDATVYDFQGRTFVHNAGDDLDVSYEASKYTQKAVDAGQDAIIYKDIKDPNLATNYGVFDTRNIHILGNAKDVDMFIIYKETGAVEKKTAEATSKPSETVVGYNFDKDDGVGVYSNAYIEYGKALVKAVKSSKDITVVKMNILTTLKVVKSEHVFAKHDNSVITYPDFEALVADAGAMKNLATHYRESVEEAKSRVQSLAGYLRMTKVHEHIHAGAVNFMRENPKDPKTKYINNLYKTLLKKAMADKALDNIQNGYWKTNVDEFIAVALSNPDMLKYLSGVKVQGTTSMYHKFVQKIAGMVGLLPDSEGTALLNMFMGMIDNDVAEYGSTKQSEESLSGREDHLKDMANGIKPKNEPKSNTDVKGNAPVGGYQFKKDGETYTTNEGQTLAINAMKDWYYAEDPTKPHFLLQGRGGTGKTTVINVLMEQLGIKSNEVAFVTPTHKALKVIRQSNKSNKYGTSEYKTIASLLGVKPKYDDTGNIVAFEKEWGAGPVKMPKVIVIDEASMLHSTNYKMLMKEAADSGTRIVFMGDHAQLTPVKDYLAKIKSVVFSELEDSTVHLNQLMRQSEDSPIITFTDIIINIVNAVEEMSADGAWAADQADVKLRDTRFDGSIYEMDATTGDGVVLTTESFDEIFPQFMRDYENDPINTKYIHYNNHVNEKTIIITDKIRNKLFGDRAAKEVFIKGEPLVLNDSTTPTALNGEDLATKETLDNGEEFTVVGYELIKNKRVDYTIGKHTRTSAGTIDVYKITATDNVTGDTTVFLKPVRDADVETLVKKELSIMPKSYNIEKKKGYANRLRSFLADSLSLGYVINGHKAQGSTYGTVYLDIGNIIGLTGPSANDKIKSIYVGASRPTKRLVVIDNRDLSSTIVNGKPLPYTGGVFSDLGTVSTTEAAKNIDKCQ